MGRRNRWPANLGIGFAFGLLLGTFAGCKTHASTSAQSGSGAAAEAADSGAHIDLLCLGDRINSPSGPFHYSYKYLDESNSIDNEADITPQKMDITSTDRSGTHSYHGVRSDEASWNAAVLDLSSLRFTGMTARIDSLNGSSSITSQGAESMNGYSTTKYSIDTAGASAADQKQFQTLFGAGSFEKGTVWVPADGCAVKLILDEAIVQTNGNANKGHYEVAMIKK
ncbi:MAG TPA: hypothetical protein VGI45_32415 [Terracidiphilus sp.]|jgi:hypothetical protein